MLKLFLRILLNLSMYIGMLKLFLKKFFKDPIKFKYVHWYVKCCVHDAW